MGHEEHFSEQGFWDHLLENLGRFARERVVDLLTAYYAATDSETPLETRAMLLGALGYFVLPLDVIPDFLVPLGFTDDFGVLVAALRAVASSIRPEHRERARRKVDELLGGD